MRWIAAVTLLGLSACAPVSDSAICAGLGRPIADLRAGLERHPETPQAVGEPATDVVLGFEGACK